MNGKDTVYRCDFLIRQEAWNDRQGRKYTKSACGVNGETFDASHDECHHTLTLHQGMLYAGARELADAAAEMCRLTRAMGGGGAVVDRVEQALRDSLGYYSS